MKSHSKALRSWLRLVFPIRVSSYYKIRGLLAMLEADVVRLDLVRVRKELGLNGEWML